MSSTLDNLLSAASAQIAALPSGKAWEREMQATLARLHTAAYLAATAERLGVRVETLKGLSKAERAEIKRAVGEQLEYLRGFAQDRAGLSEAQVSARAAMYAGGLFAKPTMRRDGVIGRYRPI